MSLVRKTVFVLLSLCLAQLGYTQHMGTKFGFELAQGKKKLDIPFEIYNNLIIVDVVLNKVIPLKFIVDTGVKTSILADRIYLDILHVDYDRSITLVGAAGGIGVEALIANNVSLEMPGLTCHGLSIFVMTEDYLRLGNSLGISVHGILGSELFNRFVVKVNYATRTLTLYEPSAFKRNPRGYEVYDLLIEESKPYIRASIVQGDTSTFDGKFLIDTGASHSAMLHVGSNEKIYVPEPNISALLGRGLSGDIYGKVGRISSISLGKFNFNSVLTSFPDSSSYQGIIGETKRQGTIGGNLMNRLHLIFDYSQKKLYVRKGSGYSRPFDTDMTGMEILATGVDFKIFLINEVRENTPAQRADIRAGDVIVKINHSRAYQLTLSQIYRIFNSKPGRKIHLKILRNQQVIKKTIVLERLI
ncbi:aspartyl protease family protein [Cytophagales bacterium LB-30]|uniref:Aspartyl protease family protein n=1 Tax=Shiella aurantiaca TaxID=3058365 RepID=A0ABT8F8P5_9BACT|nr:aspartyl protease family protein [Shiella aurantiaca]MDN4166802.1 aspartyl protease family protein [Shiella aurantiaca]